MVGWTDETTVVRLTHWEVRGEVLIQSTLSVNNFGAVGELRVRCDLLGGEVSLISITVRVCVDVVFGVIEVGIGLVSVISCLKIVILPL